MIGRTGVFVGIVTLLGCSDTTEVRTEPVRGLRTFEVSETGHSVERRYPSVIQPHDETQLAFEVGGQMLEVELKEGEPVKKGQLLLRLDPSSFELRVQEANASVAQSQAALDNAVADYERQEELWEKRVIPRSHYDDAEAALNTTTAQHEQAAKRLDIVRDDLAKTRLEAPFDGFIASVSVDAFATVGAGEPVLTLYADNAFETAFSVPSTVINAISVGDAVSIVVPELPGVSGSGTITEVGSRARQVAAFPVVAVLDRAQPMIKAGMSAEVVMMIQLPGTDEGFLVPINCFELDATSELARGALDASVFVFEPASSTVRRRAVTVSDVRENAVIVTSGLSAGERIASAGVSYLRDGQEVRLLDEAR